MTGQKTRHSTEPLFGKARARAKNHPVKGKASFLFAGNLADCVFYLQTGRAKQSGVKKETRQSLPAHLKVASVTRLRAD